MTLHTQAMTMVVMIIGGIYLGFSLETYRRLARSFRKYTLFVYLFEIVFWLSQTAILFFVLYKVNNGELRFYVFLACLLGYSIYNVICKRVYQKVLEGLINAGKTIIRWVIQAIQVLLLQPILWLCQLLLLLLQFIWRVLKVILSYPIKLCVFLLKSILPESFLKKISKFYALCSTIRDKLIHKVKKTIEKWR